MCKKIDCEYWIDTPMGESHVKCVTCKESTWKPKSVDSNYRKKTTEGNE